MQPDFWLEKWQRGETGFHQDEVNPYLARYWPRLEALGKVFVPLCGKSRDMRWLRRQGHEVLGVELAELAVRAFFEEAGQQPAQISVAISAVTRPMASRCGAGIFSP